tara:strand:+ start:2270 stop:2413 length:144 start_codon:yes stop_codon:yes gene_type:complete
MIESIIYEFLLVMFIRFLDGEMCLSKKRDKKVTLFSKKKIFLAATIL